MNDQYVDTIQIAAQSVGVTLTDAQAAAISDAVYTDISNSGLERPVPAIEPEDSRWKKRYAELEAEFAAYRRQAESAVKSAMGIPSHRPVTIGRYNEVHFNDDGSRMAADAPRRGQMRLKTDIPADIPANILPATIPDLLEPGCPCGFIEYGQWYGDMIFLDDGRVWDTNARIEVVTSAPIFLDLREDAGFDRAVRWLADRMSPLGRPYGSCSFHADPSADQWSYDLWTLWVDGVAKASIYDADPAHPGFGPAAIPVPGVSQMDRLQALKAAVTAVAGRA